MRAPHLYWLYTSIDIGNDLMGLFVINTFGKIRFYFNEMSFLVIGNNKKICFFWDALSIAPPFSQSSVVSSWSIEVEIKRCLSDGRLVLILAGAVCYIFICFWYISTVS